MKKYLPIVAGALLGLLFIMASVMFLLKLAPNPKLPEGSPIALFMGAFGPTGYMTFVKIFELSGGILVAIPRTRNLGLLVLGPVIVNIVAFHMAFAPAGLAIPLLLLAAEVYLAWSHRAVFAPLLRAKATPSTERTGATHGGLAAAS